MVEPHGQHRVARLQQGLVDGQVGVRPGVGLHVGVLGPEQCRQAVAGQVLDLVDDLVPPVVAAPGVALGVLVGQHRSGGGQHGGGREVLRGDQLDGGGLALDLGPEQCPDLGVAAEPLVEGRGVGGAAHGVGCCLSGSCTSRSGRAGGAEARVEAGDLVDAPLVAAALEPGGEEGVDGVDRLGRAGGPARPGTPRWRRCAGGPAPRWWSRGPRRPGCRAPCWRRCRCRSRCRTRTDPAPHVRRRPPRPPRGRTAGSRRTPPPCPFRGRGSRARRRPGGRPGAT